jgi:hypothetical protein
MEVEDHLDQAEEGLTEAGKKEEGVHITTDQKEMTGWMKV